ncbi:condensation domain-containing protein [Streptomyces diastatochromogenes]|nr:condensation domain-containing protein [Streptomyces diastatochromogenes]
MEAEAARPFDVAGEPGFKVMLLRLSADEHVLFWLMSHLVCDGWSKSVFARELSALYTAHTTGTAADIPKLSVDFGDYVTETRGRPRIATDLVYWREQLRGVADQPRYWRQRRPTIRRAAPERSGSRPSVCPIVSCSSSPTAPVPPSSSCCTRPSSLPWAPRWAVRT